MDMFLCWLPFLLLLYFCFHYLFLVPSLNFLSILFPFPVPVPNRDLQISSEGTSCTCTSAIFGSVPLAYHLPA